MSEAPQFRICNINGKCSDYCSFYNDKMCGCDLGREPGKDCPGNGLWVMARKARECYVCKEDFPIKDLRIRTVSYTEHEHGGQAFQDYMCMRCDLKISKMAIQCQTNPHPTWWHVEKAMADAIKKYLHDPVYKEILCTYWDEEHK